MSNRFKLGLAQGLVIPVLALALGHAALSAARTRPKTADAFCRDGRMLLGEVDARGEFRAEEGLSVAYQNLAKGVGTSEETVVPIRRYLNLQAVRRERSGPLYEYRSGRLIPGIIDEDGYFVPDVGGVVCSVEEYDAKHDTRPIYNRPLPPVERVTLPDSGFRY